MEACGIGWAVKEMQNGARVRRAGWNGKGMWLALQVPDAHSANTLPYVYIVTGTGARGPWNCSQADLLAIDWEPATDDAKCISDGCETTMSPGAPRFCPEHNDRNP